MTTETHEHLPGCAAAISLVGARDDCRCSELAAFFRVPTPEECFGDQDPAQRRARWETARREAAGRYDRLMQDMLADERAALARYTETAADAQRLGRDIQTAKQLFADYLASGPK